MVKYQNIENLLVLSRVHYFLGKTFYHSFISFISFSYSVLFLLLLQKTKFFMQTRRGS